MILAATPGDRIVAEASGSGVTVAIYGLVTDAAGRRYDVLGRKVLTGVGTEDDVATVASGAACIFSELVIVNNSGASRTVKLWHVPNAGATGALNLLLPNVTIPANKSLVWCRGEVSLVPPEQGDADVVGPGASTDDDVVLFDGATGKLLKDSGKRIAAASGVASLDSSSLVVQNPANATATATASKIPISDGSATLDGWITDATTSAKGKVQLATSGEASATKAVIGTDSRLSDARAPTGHHASHEPAGGDAMAVDAAAGTGSLRTLGTAATSAAAGNDGRLIAGADYTEKTFRSVLGRPAASFVLISGRAYAIYLGRIPNAMTLNWVKFFVTVVGSGAQTAEAGLFSSTGPPAGSGLTITKIAASGSLDALNSTGTKGNSSTLSAAIAAGTYLWAVLRTAMATTQPTVRGLSIDMGDGIMQELDGASSLTSITTLACTIIADSSNSACPDLVARVNSGFGA